MNRSDDINGADPKTIPSPRPDTADGNDRTGWLDALNAFLDRALKADIDTGC